MEMPFPYLMTGPGAGAAVTAAGVFSNIMEARASKGWSDILWAVDRWDLNIQVMNGMR